MPCASTTLFTDRQQAGRGLEGGSTLPLPLPTALPGPRGWWASSRQPFDPHRSLRAGP